MPPVTWKNKSPPCQVPAALQTFPCCLLLLPTIPKNTGVKLMSGTFQLSSNSSLAYWDDSEMPGATSKQPLGSVVVIGSPDEILRTHKLKI